jgi:hypothetical protein
VSSFIVQTVDMLSFGGVKVVVNSQDYTNVLDVALRDRRNGAPYCQSKNFTCGGGL